MLYTILGKYPGSDWEEIESDVAKEDLVYMLGEYKLAFDNTWRFKTIKQK